MPDAIAFSIWLVVEMKGSERSPNVFNVRSRFILHHPSSELHYLSFELHHPPPELHRSSFEVQHPSFKLHHPSSELHYLSFELHHPPPELE